MINSFFIDCPYPEDVCDTYCSEMRQAGMASDGLNCNIIMWWDSTGYLQWNVGAWVRAHDRHGLCYGISTGQYGDLDQLSSNIIELKNSNFLLDNIYLDYELGTGAFSASAYLSAIRGLDRVHDVQKYFVSPYTNVLSLAAAKRLHKEALAMSRMTGALIVVCPQDGVGACKYPGSPVSSSNRYPGKAGFRKVQQFYKYLHGMGTDRVIYRVNAETFAWKAKPATKERVRAQIDAFGPYSTDGLGPCWCFYPEMIGV